VEKTGFETRAWVGRRLGYVRVEAKGEGIETGVSEVVGVDEVC
jgi:hypothetical protein